MAGIIPRSFIDTLLDRVDVVEVVDSRVKLKKTGKNYSACCPFHDEKTPSFTVSPDKQFYYCFGCGASGNAVGFVMDYERLSFPEAIESLARTAGIEVPREEQGDPKQRQREKEREDARKQLYRVMEEANDYFMAQLREHAQKQRPVDYLKRRGLSGQIAKDFGIGYAPPGWDNLLAGIGTSNAKQDALLEAGMLIHNQDKDSLYDRFRDRVSFPIRDTRGRVVGFGGRVLTDEKPKYLNSPETPIFNKGQELYGLFEARQAYRQLPRLLVVEGYMDVVALAQFDIRYAVATLGTACTADHLQRAFRFTSEVVFCFDGDEAGRKAARRAMENALPVMEDGRQVKFLYLPEGEDPDTLVRQVGAEKFTRRIEGAVPLEHFLFDELSQGYDAETMEGRARLCKLAAPLMDQLPKGIYRELMFNQLANRSQLSVDALKRLLDELAEQAPPPRPESVTQAASSVKSDQQGSTQPGYANTAVLHQRAQQPHINEPATAFDAAKKTGAPRRHIPPAELALSLLLFQPSLASEVENIEELRLHSDPQVQLLVELLTFLHERPNFSSGQVLGHWQGTYGQEKSEQLRLFMAKAMRFYLASNLSKDSEDNKFTAGQELVDVIERLCDEQRHLSSEQLLQQINSKPFSQWTDAEKSLYQKAIKRQG